MLGSFRLVYLNQSLSSGGQENLELAVARARVSPTLRKMLLDKLSKPL